MRVRLDSVTALYDRRSGQTHIVDDVTLAIVDALVAEPLSRATLAEVLDVGDARAALDARLDELRALGLLGAA